MLNVRTTLSSWVLWSYTASAYKTCFDLLQPSVHNDTPGSRQGSGVTMPGRWMRSLALLLLCVQSSLTSVLTAASSYQFTAFRMQQYHLGQQKHGEAPAVEVAQDGRCWTAPSMCYQCAKGKWYNNLFENYPIVACFFSLGSSCLSGFEV